MALLSVLLCAALLSVSAARPTDWLVDTVATPVSLSKDGDYLTLSNGLIRRQFALTPGFGTTDYFSEAAQLSILRAINPEAYVSLDGLSYAVGGLASSGTTAAYLNRTSLELSGDPNAFQFVGYSTSAPVAPFHWKPGLRHSPIDACWPPEGLTLNVQFKPPQNVRLPEHANVMVNISYEMYQGIPLMAKWVTVTYDGEGYVKIDSVTAEYLATQKPYAPFSYGSYPNPWEHDTTALTGSWLFVDTTLAHGTTVSWTTDPLASKTAGADEPLLSVNYSSGPGVILVGKSGKNKPRRYSYSKDSHDFGPELKFVPKVTGPNPFESFRVLELVVDSDDRERMALSRHRMTRTLTPQTQENPIYFHCTDSSPIGMRYGVDQMVEVGMDMFIYSFGSGFNLEAISRNETLIDIIAADILYAHSKGIEVGGYDLICLDRGNQGYGGNAGYQWDVVEEDTFTLGQDVCFASGWYDVIRDIIFDFITKTSMDGFETDGPYGGGECASVTHEHHMGFEDSVFWQNYYQGKLYSELKEFNIFVNQPDHYFYQGANKAPMGYSEDQYSLPRWEDLTVSRAGMYDDTYHYTPTQGWMFVPISQYHGGGAAAEFLSHTLEYEWALAQYLGYGVAACYRGPVLYDNEATKSVLVKWISFYKEYRDILTSDIVHVRRPDAQDVDCILHVNPRLDRRGLAMVYNPTSSPLSRNLSLPLYYTGISTTALLLQEGGKPGTNYTLERDYSVTVPLKMAPKTITWFLVFSAD